MVVMHPRDAKTRLLTEGELAWVYGPRRHELATVQIDTACARGRRRPPRHRRRVAVGDRSGHQARPRHARTPTRRPRLTPRANPRDRTQAASPEPRDARHPRRDESARSRHAGRASARISRSTSFRKSAPAKDCAIPATATRRTRSSCRGAWPRSKARRRVLLGSGMGATACALLALLRPGDHLLASAGSTAERRTVHARSSRRSAST